MAYDLAAICHKKHIKRLKKSQTLILQLKGFNVKINGVEKERNELIIFFMPGKDLYEKIERTKT